MENFTVEINGIEVNARYTKDNIEQIFIPLLRKLTKMKQDKKKRILVMLAAPPGTGKSTLCEYLKYLSTNVDGINPIQIIGLVDGDIVILEGNYLLLDSDGWNELKQYADYTIRISAKESDLRQRLIERKVKSGASFDDAVLFVDSSDLYNARTCLKHSVKGDMNFCLNSDDSYSLAQEKHRYSSEPDIPDCGCIYGG